MSRHLYLPFILIVLLALVLGVGLAPLGVAAWPSEAQPQATFTVDSASDAQDASPGDGACADSLGRCTLRAAIEEANAGIGGDTIVFAGPTYIYVDQVLGVLPAIARPGTTIDASGVWNTVEDRPGVQLNCVSGSFVGLWLTGSYDNVYGLHIFNCGDGMWIDSGHNMVGGTAPGQRNVLSGNTFSGIWISDSAAQYNNIQGNWIGLSVLGDTAAPNGGSGIMVAGGAANNTIGGDTAAQGNYISGNTGGGVDISGAGTDGNRLGANTIGLGADDSTRLGNGYYGVRVYEGPQNTWIGGGSLIGNTIVDSGLEGVIIQNAHWNIIQGNIIRENTTEGIYLLNGGNNQVVANTITQNTLTGVVVLGATAINNLITANSIHDNGAEGIALLDGGNGELAAPVITGATSSRVEGTACASCMVDVYSDSADEGETYHGSANADASGSWVYTGTITGPNATATNRNAQNNTSEFSAPVPVSTCTPVSGVTISGPATGVVYVPVCFTATVTPGNASPPIEYLWDPVPGSGQNTAVVCYTWSSAGTYVITATAGNCGGAGIAHDTHTITIGGGACVPVTGVTITGPTSGLVGVTYGFQATVTPANATAPIAYTWTPAPGGGQGTSNASYTWPAAGTYQISVAVSNCGGAGTGTADHTITISAGTVYRVFLPVVEKGQ